MKVYVFGDENNLTSGKFIEWTRIDLAQNVIHLFFDQYIRMQVYYPEKILLNNNYIKILKAKSIVFNDLNRSLTYEHNQNEVKISKNNMKDDLIAFPKSASLVSLSNEQRIYTMDNNVVKNTV